MDKDKQLQIGWIKWTTQLGTDVSRGREEPFWGRWWCRNTEVFSCNFSQQWKNWFLDFPPCQYIHFRILGCNYAVCQNPRKSSEFNLIKKTGSFFAKISDVFSMFWKCHFSDLSENFKKMVSNSNFGNLGKLVPTRKPIKVRNAGPYRLTNEQLFFLFLIGRWYYEKIFCLLTHTNSIFPSSFLFQTGLDMICEKFFFYEWWFSGILILGLINVRP